MNDFFASLEHAYDEHGDVVVDTIERSDSDLTIAMTIVAPCEPPSRWRLVLRDVREHEIQLGLCESFDVHDTHPLLWPHVDPRGSLFFSKTAVDPRALIGRLWVRHQRETDGWLPFERFLNHEVELEALLEGGFGLLAKGPDRLLRAYADELDANGVTSSVAALHPPKSIRPLPGKGDGAFEWVDYARPLKAITMDESYVVAADIEIRRM